MPYIFHIEFCEDVIIHKQSGLVYAASYSDATAKVSQYYGEDNLVEVKLVALENSPIILESGICDKVLREGYINVYN